MSDIHNLNREALVCRIIFRRHFAKSGTQDDNVSSIATDPRSQKYVRSDLDTFAAARKSTTIITGGEERRQLVA